MSQRFGWSGVAVWSALVLVGCTDKGGDSGLPSDGGAADGGAASTVSWDAAFDTSSAGALSGVWGTAPDDVFIVGGTDVQGEVYHYDGAAWSAMDVPKGLALLVWSYGFGPDDVYSVGVDGSMAHYDGATWTAIDTGTDADLWGVWGTSGSDLWVVGGVPDSGGDCGDEAVDGEKTCIWHYDGSSLSPVAIGKGENDRGATSMFKVWGIDDKLFTVGQNGLVLQYDGSAWTRISAGAEANDDFVSLWGPSSDNIVAVGGRSSARIAHFDGSAWETTAPSGYGGLNAVYMLQDDLAVIGGIYGMVGTYQPSTGEIVEEGPVSGGDIHAIWGDGAGRYYAVGGHFTDPYTGVAYVRTGG